MITKPKFMEDESNYDYDEDDEIILTEKGLKDAEVVKEYTQFIKDLINNR